MKEKEAPLVEVFAGSLWETELVKGLLESNGIKSTLKDGLMTVIAPYISQEVTVFVNEEDYESAMEIIRNRNKEEKEE